MPLRQRQLFLGVCEYWASTRQAGSTERVWRDGVLDWRVSVTGDCIPSMASERELRQQERRLRAERRQRQELARRLHAEERVRQLEEELCRREADSPSSRQNSD